MISDLKFALGALLLLLFTTKDNYVLAQQNNHEDAVKLCFEEYTNALLARDGNKAYTMLNRNSRKFYDNVLLMCREYDSLQLEKEGWAYKRMVLTIREVRDPDSLMAITGKQLFIFNVENNLDNMSSMTHVKLGGVTIRGDKATINALTDEGQVVKDAFHFSKEQTTWKFDLTGNNDRIEEGIKEFIEFTKKSGSFSASRMSETGVFIQLMQSETGVIITPKAWIPSRKAAKGKYK